MNLECQEATTPTYIKVEHKCVDNRDVTSAVARGVKDDRPQLERISPNIEYGNYLSRKGIEVVLREFKNAEKNDKNLWKNITGGNAMRKWIPDMYDNNVKRTSSTYYSFAVLSPHSTQKSNNSNFTLEYSYLYTRPTDLLKGPNQALHNIPNLPPITKEVVLAFPDFSKPFEIYTDASTLQLGAVITQDNRPIAFFSQNSLARNLNAPLPN